MANRRIEDKQNHEARVAVRLTQEEHLHLKELAKSHGLSLSELIRSRVKGTKITSKADSLAIANLNKLTGLFKHLLMEADGARIYRKQINELIEEIKRAIIRIA